MKINERLKNLREDTDLLQSDVAKKLEISQQYYSNYERGIQELPIRHLITLCDLYGVSADYIIGRSEELNPQKIEKIEIIGRGITIIKK